MPPLQLEPEQVTAAMPKIIGLGQAHVTGQCINAIVKMGVADALGAETLSVPEIAARLEGTPNEDMLLRCMRLLALHGLFAETAGPGGVCRFALTPMGALLQRAAPGQPSAACAMFNFNERCFWDAWLAVPDMVAGKVQAPSPFEAANGVSLFTHFAQSPESAQNFNEWMSLCSAGELPVVLDAVPWASLAGKKVVDVGGSLGTVMGAVKARFPAVEAVAFDLPEVVASVAEPPPGVEMVAGDMFQAGTIPRAGAIFMKHILHDWDDADCLRILASCVAALEDGGRIFIAECVLPGAGAASEHALVGLHYDACIMMMGGRERTAGQWGALAAAAGLRVAEVISTPMPSVQIIVIAQ